MTDQNEPLYIVKVNIYCLHHKIINGSPHGRFFFSMSCSVREVMLYCKTKEAKSMTSVTLFEFVNLKSLHKHTSLYELTHCSLFPSLVLANKITLTHLSRAGKWHPCHCLLVRSAPEQNHSSLFLWLSL